MKVHIGSGQGVKLVKEGTTRVYLNKVWSGERCLGALLFPKKKYYTPQCNDTGK